MGRLYPAACRGVPVQRQGDTHKYEAEKDEEPQTKLRLHKSYYGFVYGVEDIFDASKEQDMCWADIGISDPAPHCISPVYGSNAVKMNWSSLKPKNSPNPISISWIKPVSLEKWSVGRWSVVRAADKNGQEWTRAERMSGSAGAEYGWVRMGTDGYGEKSHGFDHIFLRTNPYKSVQIRTNPELWSDRPARKYRGVHSTRFIGRLSLTRAACVLALSEQREAEKPDPEKARKYRAARLNFSKPVAKERIEHP